ncbi:MAG: hypothetical protein KJO07_19790 [Deltaproteobacteria bacterium]|nr:hypothetical protein [Deltaproteobacteria bacterium]
MSCFATLLPLAVLALACAADGRGNSGSASNPPETGGASGPAVASDSRAGSPPPIAPLAGDRCLPVVECRVPQRRCEMVKQSTAFANPNWRLERVVPGQESDATVTYTFDVIETQQRCRRRPLHTASPVGCVEVGGKCATRAGLRGFAPECSRAIGSAKVAVARVWRGKPPARTVYLDVTINNASESERWFLLGSRVDQNWIPQASEISVRNLRTAGGELYRFHGEGGFLAVRVAARSTLTLTEVPTEAFADVPSPLHLHLVTVAGLEVAGKPVDRVVRRKLKAAAGTASANYRDLERTGKGDVLDSPHAPFLASTKIGPLDSSGLRDDVAVKLTAPCAIAMGP